MGTPYRVEKVYIDVPESNSGGSRSGGSRNSGFSGETALFRDPRGFLGFAELGDR